MFFFQFWASLCGFFTILFPEAPASCGKKNLKQFLLRFTSFCMSSESMSQIFNILFQTGNINVCLLRGVFFNRSVQLKRHFLTKKTSVTKSEAHCSREAIRV